MSQSYFSIDNYNQSFSIDPSEISSTGGNASPYLQVSLELDLTPLKLSNNKQTNFILLSIEASLTFKGFPNKTTETVKICNIDVKSNSKHKPTLYFPFDQHKISIIEKYREENVSFIFNATFHYGIYQKLAFPDQIGVEFLNRFGSNYRTLQVEIPHSDWVKRILPNLGFQAFKLIEMPLASSLIPDEFKKSIDEIQEAEKYFNNGDYDKAVGHCRSALDPFKSKMDIVKDIIKRESESESKYIDKMTIKTYEWLDAIFKSNLVFTSKPHHPPSMGHFDRHEAEAIYLITVGIIVFIGKLKVE